MILFGLAVAIHQPDNAQADQPFRAFAIAWSHDGNRIAVGGGNLPCGQSPSTYAIRILNAAGQLINTIERHNCGVLSLAWSPDDTRLASGGMDGYSYISDPVTGELITQSKSSAFGLQRREISWNSQGTQVADFSPADNKVFIWNPDTGDTETVFQATENIASLAWSPTGQQLAVGTIDKKIHLIDAVSGQVLNTFDLRAGSLAWSPDGSKLAVGGLEVLIVDPATGQTLMTFDDPDTGILDVDWNPDSIRLATTAGFNTVRVWDTITGSQLDVFTAETPIGAIDWRPDGTKLAYGGRGDQLVTIVQALQLPTSTSAVTPHMSGTSDKAIALLKDALKASGSPNAAVWRMVWSVLIAVLEWGHSHR